MKQSYSELWSLICRGQVAVRKIACSTLLVCLSATAFLTYPLIVQQIVERLGNGIPIGNLGWILILVIISGTFLSAWAGIVIAKVTHEINSTLRNDLQSKMLRLPVYYFEQSNTGDRVSRILSDCQSISKLATENLVNLLSGVITLFGTVLILFWLDTYLTVVLLITSILTFLVAAPAVIRMESVAEQHQNITAKLGGILTHIFSEIRLVKAFSAETHECKRGKKVVEELRDRGYSLDKLRIVFETIVGTAIFSALVLILIYGGYRIGRGDLSMGVLTAFILYIFNITGPMAMIGSFFSELQSAKGASSHISRIFRESEEHYGDDTLTSVKPTRIGSLEFRNVTFEYPQNKLTALLDINLLVNTGKTTALVGTSGSGKTTLLSLIERFYRPSVGEILYDGTSINNFNLKDWRNRIGYVSQDTPIMPGSIKDNITYGLETQFSGEEIKEAARKACALEFIERLPNGFDTQLLEQGLNISGGERQRISIARVFLRNPYLLLLDEATSSLDSETEHSVYNALDTLMKGRTSIVIAHRLSTVIQADKIAFIHNGQITGVGNHHDLYRSNSKYAGLVDRQFSGHDNQISLTSFDKVN